VEGSGVVVGSTKVKPSSEYIGAATHQHGSIHKPIRNIIYKHPQVSGAARFKGIAFGVKLMLYLGIPFV
jgi:hypothetical protein